MKLRTIFLYTTLLFYLILKPKPVKPDPDDQECLTQLYTSFQNPTTLLNWTNLYFSNPCYNGFDSHMLGITCNNGRIFRLSLPNLSLRGTLSPSISKCSNLQTLDLSSNSVSGEIPSDIKDLTNLVILNLSNNQLTSQIPASLYLCAYLNIIDLHNNELTGSIPSQLGLLARLTTFNVANNKLEGVIPTSLGKFNESNYKGNKELYGYPLDPYKGEKGLSVMAIVGIGLGSGLLSLVISFTIVCVWLKISEHKLIAAEEAKIRNLMPDY